MAFERDVGSPFTGMIFLLRQILPDPARGRSPSSPTPDFGYAVRRQHP